MQKSTIIAIAAAVGGLLVGTGMGAAAQPEAAPSPAVTITATPEPAPTVTVSAAPVTTTEVPQYCLDAIGDAEVLFTLSAELMNMWGEHIQRDGTLFAEMSTGDFSGTDSYVNHLETQTARINEITDKMSGSSFNLNKGRCRDAAGES